MCSRVHWSKKENIGAFLFKHEYLRASSNHRCRLLSASTSTKRGSDATPPRRTRSNLAPAHLPDTPVANAIQRPLDVLCRRLRGVSVFSLQRSLCFVLFTCSHLDVCDFHVKGVQPCPVFKYPQFPPSHNNHGKIKGISIQQTKLYDRLDTLPSTNLQLAGQSRQLLTPRS